ncbi:hypothetical protein N9N28_18065 [Rubripirellula amarantea]|nr:hypothetical protein [Rubripirellula amarantea]
MIRPITICALFAAASLFHCDSNAQEINNFDNGADSNTPDGAFADASPAELELLTTIDEPLRKILSNYLSKEFDKYESRITQLEDQLAKQSNTSPQSLYATPTPVNGFAQAAHTTPSPYAPAPTQSNETSSPPQPNAPAKTWQRVNLNGKWFYIVPVEHVDAFSPPQQP